MAFDTWDVADRIARELTAAGFEAERDNSRISGSAYVAIRVGGEQVAKIRISDHDLPVSYSGATFYVGPHRDGEDWTKPIFVLCERFDRPLPAMTKGVLTRHAKARAADDARNREIEAAGEVDRQRRAAIEALVKLCEDADPMWSSYNGRQRKRRRQKMRGRIAAEMGRPQ